MVQFSVSDVAFEGFRITRERPAAVAIWTVVEILLLAIVASLMGHSPAYIQLAALMAGGETDPQVLVPKLQALMPALAPVMATTMPISLIIGVILRTAVYRTVLRPTDNAFGYLRVGVDEVRVLLVTVLTALIILAVSMAIMTVIGVLGLAGPVGAFLAFLGLVAILVLVALVMLRLSLAGPQSFAERKIILFGSLKLTKPVFWPMVGSYFIAFILYLVVFVLVSVIRSGLAAVLGGVGAQSLLGVGALGLDTPLGLLELLLEGVVSGLGLAIISSPTALIYQILTRAGREVDAFV
jgi:hypothetical protein